LFSSLSAEDLGLSISFAEAVSIAAACGFDAVDLHMAEQVAEKRSVESIREQLARAGLRPGGWWLPVEFREGDDQFESDLKELGRSSSIAAGLGSRWCLTWVWPYSDELDRRANWDRHVARLSRVARDLRDSGSSLAIEFVGSKTMRTGHKYEFVSTLPQLLELVRDVGADNVGVLLDSFQWYVSGGTSTQLQELTADRIIYVHLADAPLGRPLDEQVDNERRLPGASNVVDLSTFVRTLDVIGFAGPVAVEPYDPALRELGPLDRARVARQSIDAVFARAGVSLT